MKTTIGGDRLGAGNKQEVSMKNYSRSTHDLGYVWRSSMSAGTLVPFMSEVGLPGDSFDIDLFCDVKKLPTGVPLFGSYKVQLDVFECPIRLYNGKLHMNMLNIGMNMKEILLPQYKLKAYYNKDVEDDNSQVNSSSLYSYLNVRGLGRAVNGSGVTIDGEIERDFNAVPVLAYWDIFKNYYANKQEDKAYVIHSKNMDNDWVIKTAVVTSTTGGTETTYDIYDTSETIDLDGTNSQVLVIQFEWDGANTTIYGLPDTTGVEVIVDGDVYSLEDLFNNVGQPETTFTKGIYEVTCYGYSGVTTGGNDWEVEPQQISNTVAPGQGEPILEEFDLVNIDTMRENILKAVSDTTAFEINDTTLAPYGLGLGKVGSGSTANYYATASQEGLAIKTYQSDLFNNWISTEWIDGTNGVNEISAVIVETQGTDQVVKMDALNLQQKVYNMLNRIAISGGSYDDWLDAVYTHERSKSVESPVYHGSLIKELSFEEVISNSDVVDAAGDQQPLGTLAGRGILTKKHKGGKMKVKVHEPCIIMGIVSLTPRIDYSQGNKWDTGLKTLDDLHKPALDEIGFEDRYTDAMAWFDTGVESDGTVNYNSVGKQPAWINYMTNVNQCRGNFAIDGDSMFMTLNRSYDQSGRDGITDLTTYIDPSKFNNIFAQTDRSSQNFWTQIGCEIKARRKMSAKVIPNL